MKNFKLAREASHMTQQEVAYALNIERSSYARYESGAREPDSNTLVFLANLFSVSIDFLLGHETKLNHAVPDSISILDTLPPDLRAKADDYIAMLKQLDEARNAPRGGAAAANILSMRSGKNNRR